MLHVVAPLTRSSLLRWYVPTWCGDFRLEPHKSDEGKTVLTVEDPTAVDKEKLATFLAEARDRGWIDAAAGILPTGKSVLEIGAPMVEAGPILAEQTLPDAELWTALRHKDGVVTVEDGTGKGLLDRIAKSAIAFKNGVGELFDPVAAVTIAAPARGCPPPQPAPTRASQVLAAFSTQTQYRDFVQRGYLVSFGSATGKPYRVFHRNEAARRGMGHCIVEDVEQGHEICAWDDTVPPEEEVLGLKLAVEHREPWLRGKSAMFAAVG